MSLLPRILMNGELVEDDGHRGTMWHISWGRWSFAFVIARRLPEIGL